MQPASLLLHHCPGSRGGPHPEGPTPLLPNAPRAKPRISTPLPSTVTGSWDNTWNPECNHWTGVSGALKSPPCLSFPPSLTLSPIPGPSWPPTQACRPACPAPGLRHQHPLCGPVSTSPLPRGGKGWEAGGVSATSLVEITAPQTLETCPPVQLGTCPASKLPRDLPQPLAWPQGLSHTGQSPSKASFHQPDGKEPPTRWMTSVKVTLGPGKATLSLQDTGPAHTAKVPGQRAGPGTQGIRALTWPEPVREKAKHVVSGAPAAPRTDAKTEADDTYLMLRELSPSDLQRERTHAQEPEPFSSLCSCPPPQPSGPPGALGLLSHPQSTQHLDCNGFHRSWE